MESETQRVYRLLATLRSFARNQGVPAHTVIRLASKTEVGTACAGFLDAPLTCRRPFIVLDKTLLDRMAHENQVDAMVGLVLHEAAHILYTYEYYLKRKHDRSTKLWFFENLLEDYRIEALLAQSSPGYVPYIEATKRVLLVDKWFGDAIRRWKQLADTQCIMALIGAFVRAPHVFEIHPHLKQWTDLLGRNIFEELRRRLPKPPETEADVRRMAVELNDLVHDYFNRVLKALADWEDPVSDEVRDRLIRQRDADHQEALYEKQKAEQEQARRLEQLSDMLSIGELLDAFDQQGKIGEGFDEAILSSVKRIESEAGDADQTVAEAGSVSETTAHEWLPSQLRDLVKIDNVMATNYSLLAYMRAKSRIARQKARLQSGFPTSSGATLQRSSSTTGRLDPRRLWRAPFDDRLFSQHKQTVAQVSTHITLLLDGSGSMGLNSRYERALDTAVLFCEALRSHPTATYQLYSHTSISDGDKSKCLLSVYPGRPADIGVYCPKESNYDEIAIQAVTAIERKKYPAVQKRILIVISDGLPCDIRTGEQAGTYATARAVEAVRKQGWKVLGVGIGLNHVVGIYGQRWSLCVRDAETLPDRMANMLVQLLRQCN